MSATCVLLVTPSKSNCGNFSTISRIRLHIQKKGKVCLLCDPGEFTEGPSYPNFLQSRNIGLVIGIHVYKTGKLMKDGSVPYILILGGTDVNETYQAEDKMAVMTEAVHKARGIVCFTKSMRDRLYSLWPSETDKPVFIIPQAVTVAPSSFNIRHYLQNQDPSLSLDADSKIFIIIGGIRRVKNPLFLLQDFSEWHRQNPQHKALLLLIGPKIEDGYHEIFLEKVNSLPGVVYIPGLNTEDTHAAVRDSFVLVNSSDSEGMAVSILEAMLLGTPVIVRDIPGNMEIVSDDQTGLVFSTPEEFLLKAQRLIDDSTLRQTLTHNASQYVAKQHSMETEEELYLSAISSVSKQS